MALPTVRTNLAAASLGFSNIGRQFWFIWLYLSPGLLEMESGKRLVNEKTKKETWERVNSLSSQYTGGLHFTSSIGWEQSSNDTDKERQYNYHQNI